ncbi:hypothetical protein SAMN05414139_05446 [Burkholderia sp. D7]|nr:hypothetical protein SAMN05414139_05446 [Burkholderia sp. D7]
MQGRNNSIEASVTALDEKMQANLLCFLVATVAASHTLTRSWRVDHVVESCRIWLARNRVALSWMMRVTLGQLALQIARRDLHAAGITVRQSNVQSMFTHEMGINQASTVVQRISAVCEAALRKRPAA